VGFEEDFVALANLAGIVVIVLEGTNRDGGIR